MKQLLLLILVCFSCRLAAASNDSTKTTFWKNLTIGFTVFEVGPSNSFKTKKYNDLPNGLNLYLNENKMAGAGNFLAIGCYHKNKIGFEILLSQNYNFSSESTKFNAYQDQLYSNYYVKNRFYVSGGYNLEGVTYGLSYKLNFKRFTLAPKFRLGVDNYKVSGFQYTWKEKGSNSFSHYKMEKNDLQNRNFDYHLLLEAYTSIDFGTIIEFGIVTEFMVTPTNYDYLILQERYNEPIDISTTNIKQLNMAWKIGLSAKVVLKKGEKYNPNFTFDH